MTRSLNDVRLRNGGFQWWSQQCPFLGGRFDVRWQRGANENTNGLIRQYFPKGTHLNNHSADRVAEVAQELNNRPRETLGMRTPHEIFNRRVRTAPATVARTT